MADERKKILLVEDDRFLSSLLKSRLEKEGGYEVTLAMTGDEALHALDAGAPDLIILDIILPGKSGFEVLEELRAKPGVIAPVIIMSNLGQEADVARGRDLGAVEYFVKANTPIDDLIAKIRAMIGT
ncbi:MAG: response regulator [Candidatus Harrisonbacteria bacterium]|nr:response regulator [Candidatus Harrisonbacteria bacterium]MBI3114505.1 response regulator [Candidatus Harrisonbacteria bacterium]